MPNNVTVLSAKIIRLLEGIFIRKYPWQAHFFYETLGYNRFHQILFFLLNNKLQIGEYIQRYEDQFRQVVNPDGFSFSFGTGRMALYAILEALGIGEGDEVIVPAFTCEVVVHSLLYRKIKPVYADIEPFTFNLEVSKIEEKISIKTRAIIVQHTFGVPCNLDKISEIAIKHHFFVIEDCAIALGSFYQGKPVGNYGQAAIFSTDRTKITSTQYGGLAFTRDPELAEKIKKVYLESPFLRKNQILNISFQVLLSYFILSPYVYFWGKYLFKFGFKSGLLFDNIEDKKNFKLPAKYPYPYRLSNFQSFLGIAQMDNLQQNIALRKEMAQRYIGILKKNNIDIKPLDGNFDCAPLRFSFMLKDREGFIRKWRKYFEAGKWFDSPALGWYADLEKIGYKKGSCPVAEKVFKHIVNFPTHQTSKRMRNFLYDIMNSVRPQDVLSPEDLYKMPN